MAGISDRLRRRTPGATYLTSDKDTSSNNHFITKEHPDYSVDRYTRTMYMDLYSGGARFQANSSNYLVRRHKEPNDVYFERLNRVFYENYVGSIIDWYTATLFRREAQITFDGANDSGKAFFSAFVQDCDRRGTTLTEFYGRQITQALINGKSYISLDFPRTDGQVYSRAQEDASGVSRAYLADYTADEIINWSYDAHGVLEWIVIRTSEIKQPSVRDTQWQRQTRWIYYDKQQFELYGSTGELNGPHTNPELLGAGSHALTAQNRVPVFELGLSHGLWLMNKAALLQLEHFNKSNALGWALTMGLFATPVIYSDREFAQIVGESYFIQLGPQDRFGWAEPSGAVYQVASDNLLRLQDEIYRICYMNNQFSGKTSGSAQSGASKAWDFSVTEEILRAYGDVVKDSMRAVLTAISQARQDGLEVNVCGLDDFDIQDLTSELSDAQSLLALQIPSETLKRQLFKSVALKYFSDSRQEIKSQIANELIKR